MDPFSRQDLCAIHLMGIDGEAYGAKDETILLVGGKCVHSSIYIQNRRLHDLLIHVQHYTLLIFNFLLQSLEFLVPLNIPPSLP